MEVRQMMKERGRINFTGLIMLCIIVYGGYAVVKLIAESAMETQIRKEVIDTLGTMRGADFADEDGVAAIRKILSQNDVIFDETDENAVKVTVNRSKGTISFSYKYDVEINFLFFKKIKTVELKDGLKSYD
jgi:hypothetical protein